MNLVGKKVTGFWGAMFPWSYGEIISSDGNEVEIDWNDDEVGNSYTDISNIKPFDWKGGSGESPVGIYFEEEK